jgi:cytochrome c oxidase subunit IV
MAKALIIMAVFMELRQRSGVMIAFAAAGFFWLGILIWLSGTDFVTRPQFPPHL